MKKSLFYKIYFSVIAIFLILLAIGLFIFRGWLKSYESAQPENIVKTVVSEKLEKGNILSLRDSYNLKLSKYETPKSVNAFYEKTIKDKKLSYSTSALKPEGVDMAYTVTANGKKIINIFLKKDKDKRYTVSEMAFDSSVYKSCKISAAENVTIKINGIKVDKSDRKNDKLPNLKTGLSGDIINKQIISLNDLLYTPEIVAESGGKTTELKAVNGIYTAIQNFPEKSEVAKIAGKGASEYASYMFNDSSLSNVRNYVDTDTDFYENLRTSIVSFTLNHNGNSIEDLKTSDFHKYSNNLYSCRVTLTNVLKRGGERYKDYFDKYVYLKKSGDSYKIIDMQNTSGDAK